MSCPTTFKYRRRTTGLGVAKEVLRLLLKHPEVLARNLTSRPGVDGRVCAACLGGLVGLVATGSPSAMWQSSEPPAFAAFQKLLWPSGDRRLSRTIELNDNCGYDAVVRRLRMRIKAVERARATAQ